ncbi:cell surface protein [candidate division TA06 bacterium B3_TA06]|uniref:Cell surface protein n=1 Tax=candidate division TA06 bacterium B3_TA06 TaxID=2012487 RepID=A0A532V8G0_UNCT6|nr:MAG: cell surface protein [candidate division TA06 bacterium B3_TA06]
MDKESHILVFCAMLLLISGCKTEEPDTLKWKYKTDGSILSSPAIGHNGTVYITSGDSCLYAFSSKGKLKWRFKTEGKIFATPSIGADGTIYISSWDAYTYAITPDGELKWEYETQSVSSPAIANDRTLLVANIHAHLFAITPEGKLKWKSSLDTSLNIFPPVIAAGGAVYSGGSNKVYAHDSLGNLKWSFEVPDTCPTTTAPLAIESDGNICFCTNGGGFYVLTPQGKLKARLGPQHVLTNELASPVIGSDGTIYVNSDGCLWAINPTGDLKWRYRIDSTLRVFSPASPAVGSDGTIYIGTKDRGLIALNADGSLRWEADIDSEIFSSPAISDDGFIYVGSKDGYLYAIHSDSKGLADSPWPKYQHDNQNTGRAGGGI